MAEATTKAVRSGCLWGRNGGLQRGGQGVYFVLSLLISFDFENECI